MTKLLFHVNIRSARFCIDQSDLAAGPVPRCRRLIHAFISIAPPTSIAIYICISRRGETRVCEFCNLLLWRSKSSPLRPISLHQCPISRAETKSPRTATYRALFIPARVAGLIHRSATEAPPQGATEHRSEPAESVKRMETPPPDTIGKKRCNP